MYRLFGNVPVGRSNETQMSADWMAIENRKKARENQENIKRGEKRRTTKAPVGAKAARSGKNGARGYAWPGANSYCTVALDASQRRVAWGMKRGKITESGGGKQ